MSTTQKAKNESKVCLSKNLKKFILSTNVLNDVTLKSNGIKKQIISVGLISVIRPIVKPIINRYFIL